MRPISNALGGRGSGKRAEFPACRGFEDQTRVWLPYLKILAGRLANGKRKWALSWRPAREADLRNIWNRDISLDKHRRGSPRQ